MKRYGIIKTDSIYIPGDERSRINPGHGYPAYTLKQEVISEYENREEWETRINELANPKYGDPENFRAIIFEEVEVKTEVKINILE